MNPLADLSNQLLAGMLTHGYAVLALVLVLAAIGVPLPASLVATVAGTLLAGASHLRFPIFVGYALLGRVLWVAVFVGLGYAFASSAAKAADFASSLSGLVGIAGVAVLLALATRRPRKLSER